VPTSARQPRPGGAARVGTRGKGPSRVSAPALYVRRTMVASSWSKGVAAAWRSYGPGITNTLARLCRALSMLARRSPRAGLIEGTGATSVRSRTNSHRRPTRGAGSRPLRARSSRSSAAARAARRRLSHRARLPGRWWTPAVSFVVRDAQAHRLRMAVRRAPGSGATSMRSSSPSVRGAAGLWTFCLHRRRGRRAAPTGPPGCAAFPHLRGSHPRAFMGLQRRSQIGGNHGPS
jgi:hypothetical protein